MAARKKSRIVLSGYDYVSFCQDSKLWTGDRYVEEEQLQLNDGPVLSDLPLDLVKPDDKVTILSGRVIHKKGDQTVVEDQVKIAQQWLEKLTHTTLIVSVANSRVDYLKAVIEEAGGRIVEQV